MMVFSHKQTLSFAQHGPWNAAAMRYEGDTSSSPFVLTPKPGLQEAPDWIRNTETFERAERAGYIVVVKRESPEPEVKPEPTKIEEAMIQDHGLVGVGAPTGKPSKQK